MIDKLSIPMILYTGIMISIFFDNLLFEVFVAALVIYISFSSSLDSMLAKIYILIWILVIDCAIASIIDKYFIM